MMTNTQYLLGKPAEEASELAQIAIKAQQFGLHEIFSNQPYTNEERITAEYNDVIGIVRMLNQECDANIIDSRVAQTKKSDKVSKWRNYSKELGLVDLP